MKLYRLAGAICYIELACVVPLSGGETVYIKVTLSQNILLYHLLVLCLGFYSFIS